MMITAIIVDDEKNNADRLQKLIKKNCPDIEVCAVADSVHAAVKNIQKIQPRLAFLDIELPDGKGFDILEHFDEIPFEIIFTTAFDQYALKAIKFSAVDYLLKPIEAEELKNAVAKAVKRLNTAHTRTMYDFLKQQIQIPVKNFSKIALPTMEGYQLVPIDAIIRCEADGHYTKFHFTSGKTAIASKNLKEFEGLLTEHHFCRIHHTHLINLNHLLQYVKGDGGYVIMSDQKMVEVSKRKKDELIKILSRT